jgi:hypothetical protein
MTSDLVWRYADQSGFKLCSFNHYKTNLLFTGECFCPQTHITELEIAYNCLDSGYRLVRDSFDREW